MNQLYILHTRSSNIISRFLSFISSFNSLEESNFSHTTLVYEGNEFYSNGKKQFFLMEAFWNVQKVDFVEYLDKYSSTMLDIEYTYLGDDFLKSEDIEKFENLFKERYDGADYSFSKAMTSFRFDFAEIPKMNDIIRIYRDEGFFSFAKSYLNGCGDYIANLAKGAANFIVHGVVNSAVSIKEFFQKSFYNKEDEMHDNSFFCTEFVVDFLYNWSKLEGITLDSKVNDIIVDHYQVTEIYPQRFYELLVQDNNNNCRCDFVELPDFFITTYN